MIEPLISLAFSVQANKGVYALMLGSGISRAAGIPTGWEVVEDLIRRVASANKQECVPDPATWFSNTFNEEPNYSKLLGALAKTQAERNHIIRGYFEASEEEREQGLKTPTAAHRAVASLVVSGHLRVIITTNFDRLMERALEAAGVVPSVIDSSDKIEGAMPIAHSACTVIKLHGDYMDIRIKNTPEELSQYDERMNKILDRVLDEYGLIVCGWSADYDRALEDAISRCTSRRFTTFWTYKGKLGEAAQRLVALRGAQVIKIEGADQFFGELAEKVNALEEMASPHPLTVKVAVSTGKKYLSEERYLIQLHELVARETTRLLERTSDDHFPMGVRLDEKEFLRRVTRYEAASEILLGLMITGCYWSQPYHEELWTEALKRVVNPYDDFTRTTRSVREGLSRYPALILMYGGGIAALAAEKYNNLAALLVRTKVKVINVRDMQPAASALTVRTIFESGREVNWLPNVRTERFAANEHLFNVLRAPLADVLPQDDDYQRCFDRFEYLHALVYADLDAKERASDHFWGPAGLFASELRLRERGYRVTEEVNDEAESLRDSWAPLKAGFFDGSYERFKTVVAGCNANRGFGFR